MTYLAHSAPKEGDLPQPLREHLLNTATMAANFARPFAGERIARVLGLMHDLGKYSQQFQDMIRGKDISSHRWDRDHSSAGAQYLYKKFPVAIGHLCAYAIAGHHSGLPDQFSSGTSCLESRLTKSLTNWQNSEAEELLSGIDLDFMRDCPKSLLVSDETNDNKAFSLALFCRMLFSCLVDADYLDTEAFMQPKLERPSWEEGILERMNALLDQYLKKFDVVDESRYSKRELEVRSIRNGVLEECRTAAEHEPGLFTLTVPTGGGKTLSSLAFALRHAIKHHKKRIVYVVPYISIIEQTAEQFRDVFKSIDPNPVLEVHSNIPLENRSDSDPDEYKYEDSPERLASENFDAPLVVTTAVRFYESLMGNRSSQCRKLHNLTDAVIILDEAQKIPIENIKVVLALLKDLVSVYNDTIVLCTATQPAVVESCYFPIGFKKQPREIICNPSKLYKSLERVRIQRLGKLSDKQLRRRIEQEESVLCVVNTRRHALELFNSLERREGDYHLSTMMCAAHRLEVLNQIRARLACKLPCRVISTQLVEAGVDLDFPVVYRSMTGLDSIAQAAGRCNRNGAMEYGQVYVFEPDRPDGKRIQSKEVDKSIEVWSLSQDDLLGLDKVKKFFELYYNCCKSQWDEHKLTTIKFFNFDSADSDKRIKLNFMFKSATEKFKLISDDTVSVIVDYDKYSRKLCEKLRAEGPTGSILRQLQRYTVPMHRFDYNNHIGKEIELLYNSVPVLICPSMNYNEDTGLTFDTGIEYMEI